MTDEKRNFSDVVKEKSEKLLDGISYWTTFYRLNPQRFVKDYLNIDLKLIRLYLLSLINL